MNEILNIVGVSALISIIVTFVFDLIRHKANIKFENLFSQKMERYRSILVFMSVVVNVENYKHIQTDYRPYDDRDNEKIINYYKNEIILHRSFCVLFADEKVIKCLNDFIEAPSQNTFDKTAMAMRYDLWKNKYKSLVK